MENEIYFVLTLLCPLLTLFCVTTQERNLPLAYFLICFLRRNGLSEKNIVSKKPYTHSQAQESVPLDCHNNRSSGVEVTHISGHRT